MLARLCTIASRTAREASALSRTVSTTLVAIVLLPGCDPAMLVQGAVFTLGRSVRSRVIRRVRASLGSFTRMAGPPSCPRAIRSTGRADQRRRDAAS
jgi:hypothetical protein